MVSSLTHTELLQPWPDGHWKQPALPGVHGLGLEQAPQLFESVLKSVQLPLHAFVVSMHELPATHWPPEQTCPEGQTVMLPQSPGGVGGIVSVGSVLFQAQFEFATQVTWVFRAEQTAFKVLIGWHLVARLALKPQAGLALLQAGSVVTALQVVARPPVIPQAPQLFASTEVGMQAPLQKLW
jgi:hypothetical protein